MEHGHRWVFEILVFVFTFDTSKRGGKGLDWKGLKNETRQVLTEMAFLNISQNWVATLIQVYKLIKPSFASMSLLTVINL